MDSRLLGGRQVEKYNLKQLNLFSIHALHM